MTLTLINNNFQTLNNNLELLRQSKINQSVTQQIFNPWNTISNNHTQAIDLWENNVKKFQRVAIVGEGYTNNSEPIKIIFQESNVDNWTQDFYSDGIEYEIINNSSSLVSFYFEFPYIALRYCRFFFKGSLLVIKLESIKSTL
jgi:hypothetical protein